MLVAGRIRGTKGTRLPSVQHPRSQCYSYAVVDRPPGVGGDGREAAP